MISSVILSVLLKVFLFSVYMPDTSHQHFAFNLNDGTHMECHLDKNPVMPEYGCIVDIRDKSNDIEDGDEDDAARVAGVIMQLTPFIENANISAMFNSYSVYCTLRDGESSCDIDMGNSQD